MIALFTPLQAVVDPSPGQAEADEGYLTLGSLTDFDGMPAGRTYTGTIDWGDGTAPGEATFQSTSYFGLDPTLPAGSIIEGSHVYTKAGEYTVKIAVADNQGDSATSTLVATVVAEKTFVEGESFVSTTAGDPISTILGSLVAPVAGDTPADFTAMVDWGDGTVPSPATVTAGNDSIFMPSTNRFEINGAHTYASPGLYSLTISVDSPDGTSITYVSSIGVSLADAGASFPAPSLSVNWGSTAIGEPIATFLPPLNFGVVAADFKATVDWGDGSPAESATIQSVIPGEPTPGFNVSAVHTYAMPGTFTVTTTVVGSDGIPLVMTSKVTIKAPTMPIVTPTPTPTSPMVTPSPTPTPPVVTTPIVGPMPVIAKPRPVLSPPTRAATPGPTPSATEPTSRWDAWFVGPFSPAALSSRFSKTVAPSVAVPHRISAHPAHAVPATHHGPAKPKAAKHATTHHAATKSARHVSAKHHPAGLVKAAKRAR